MNQSKNIFIKHLSKELNELLEILVKNQNNSSIYAISKIKKMLKQLKEFKYDDSLDISDIIIAITNQYKSLFIPKMGLSEFYIWDNNFKSRQQKNKEYENILEKIDKILKEN